MCKSADRGTGRNGNWVGKWPSEGTGVACRARTSPVPLAFGQHVCIWAARLHLRHSESVQSFNAAGDRTLVGFWRSKRDARQYRIHTEPAVTAGNRCLRVICVNAFASAVFDLWGGLASRTSTNKSDIRLVSSRKDTTYRTHFTAFTKRHERRRHSSNFHALSSLCVIEFIIAA